jgi:hypothetical protein
VEGAAYLEPRQLGDWQVNPSIDTLVKKEGSVRLLLILSCKNPQFYTAYCTVTLTNHATDCGGSDVLLLDLLEALLITLAENAFQQHIIISKDM